MRYFKIFLTICLAAGITGCGEKDNQNTDKTIIAAHNGYVSFPDGYGYMENLPELQAATDRGDKAIIRDHGWKLFAGIMQPAGDWPLWKTWPNTQDTFGLSGVSVDGIDPKAKRVTETVKSKNHANMVDVNTPAPQYPLPKIVKELFPGGICTHKVTGEDVACDGRNFLNNGDIMSVTESLSEQVYTDILEKELYQQSELTNRYNGGQKIIDLPLESIVTKHMYWPVKAEGITPIPVWRNNFAEDFEGYFGYEFWDTFVAIDPSGKSVGATFAVEFLYGVKNHEGDAPLGPNTGVAKVYDLEDFYYHQITQADWDSFDEADKAILTAASLWANNTTIGPGDYLVTVAMHIDTKELPSWTLQSVWWSDVANDGPYAQDKPDLPQAAGPWRHYLMTDSYAVPPNPDGREDIAVNPYIEGVIHPIATTCRNCHVRSGWPRASEEEKDKASYQNPQCPDLLAYLEPDDKCFEDIMLTDYLWIIPDRAQ